ncbi:MAG: L-2-amino-thiazoline-4-carboxylic acid hydrolase [Planctomycetes bacterium]|nr:L-2-amino-thiazoline-4-carboxylic acid hydrolase [Planctomycetota bacterium]
MSEEKFRQQLYDSFANRAHLYYLIFDEMRAELGEARAAEIMKRAIYKRGRQKGKKYAPFAPGDFEGLKEAFVGGIPDNGAMFSPEVLRCDAEGLDIKFKRCPLKEAWLESGLAEDEVAKICAIAATVDNGTFESAGFEFSADTFEPGGDGCCYLHIRPGK